MNGTYYLGTTVTSGRTHAVPATDADRTELRGRAVCGVPVFIETRNGEPIPLTSARIDCASCARALGRDA